MSDLDPISRALVEAARAGDEPTAADEARVRHAVEMRIAALAVDPSPRPSSGRATPAPRGVPATSSLVVAGKATLVAVVFGGAAIVARAHFGSHLPAHAVANAPGSVSSELASSPPRAEASLAQIADALDATPNVPQATGVLGTPPDTSSVARDVPGSDAPPNGRHDGSSAIIRRNAPARSARDQTHAPATSGADVEGEVGLVGRARASWQSGDAARALALLEEHARRYPTGELAEEREALRVAVLCRLERTAEARAARDRFLRAFPESAHAAAVRASCPSTSPRSFDHETQPGRPLKEGKGAVDSPSRGAP